MAKIVQIIGTRPQYIKLIDFKDDFVIDTGQHYSPELITSRRDNIDLQLTWQEDWEELIAEIYFELGGGWEEDVREPPKLIIVYGDTYSTYIGARVATMLKCKLMHIEAGVRTGIDTVEEIIRKKVDSLSHILLCPTEAAQKNIFKERLDQNNLAYESYIVGDLMYEKFLDFQATQRTGNAILTVHRRENLEKLPKIFKDLFNKWVNFYVHPHTEKYIKDNNISIPKNIFVYPAISYDNLLSLLPRSAEVFTDSGGLMKEAYWSGCRVHIIGNNPWPEIQAFGDGRTSERIRKIVEVAML